MRAVPFRREMIADLVELGFNNTVVLAVMAAVPRHRFVERFWATPPGKPWTPENVREFRVTDDTDDETLSFIYRADTALMTRGPLDRPGATSSVSAPIIVALMAAELDLRPGAHVLELGAGSGYHAAVMAALVGDPGLVTTVDIDPTVISETVDRFERLGLSAIDVRCGDGDLGAADRAPFDRIVATVGCGDLSPAWVEQLAPGGAILVPLEHGHLHPRGRCPPRSWSDWPLCGSFQLHTNPRPARPSPTPATGGHHRVPRHATDTDRPARRLGPHRSVSAMANTWNLGFCHLRRPPRSPRHCRSGARREQLTRRATKYRTGHRRRHRHRPERSIP
jgi:protein-L-isoaspartate O-methyltransferase